MGSEYENFDYLYQSFSVVHSQVLMTVCQLRMKLLLFFLSDTETFDQLFLRCSLVAAAGAYCSYFQKVEWVQPVIAGLRHKSAHTAEDKVAAVKLKFISWYQCLQQSKFVCFDKIWWLSWRIGYLGTKCDITGHLRHLQNLFQKYFSPNNYDKNWLRSPFSVSFW